MRLATLLQVAFVTVVITGTTALAGDFPCAPDLCGAWSGHWESCPSGHHGPLHAHFSRVDECHYRVRFHGRFAKVIPFRYAVTLNVTGAEDGKVYLASEKRLPFFGVFSFQGEATNCSFVATYCSRSDNGGFELTRN